MRSIEKPAPLGTYRICPHCRSRNTTNRHTATLGISGDEILRRYRRCRDCGRTYSASCRRDLA